MKAGLSVVAVALATTAFACNRDANRTTDTEVTRSDTVAHKEAGGEIERTIPSPKDTAKADDKTPAPTLAALEQRLKSYENDLKQLRQLAQQKPPSDEHASLVNKLEESLKDAQQKINDVRIKGTDEPLEKREEIHDKLNTIQRDLDEARAKIS